MRQKRSQIHNACAVAALSMITNKPFYEILKITHPQWRPGKNIRGTHIDRTFKCLKKLGYKYKVHACSYGYYYYDNQDRLIKKIKPRINKKIKLQNLKNDAYIGLYTRSGQRHAAVWSSKDKKIMHSGYSNFDIRYVNANKYTVIEVLGKKR